MWSTPRTFCVERHCHCHRFPPFSSNTPPFRNPNQLQPLRSRDAAQRAIDGTHGSVGIEGSNIKVSWGRSRALDAAAAEDQPLAVPKLPGMPGAIPLPPGMSLPPGMALPGTMGLPPGVSFGGCNEIVYRFVVVVPLLVFTHAIAFSSGHLLRHVYSWSSARRLPVHGSVPRRLTWRTAQAQLSGARSCWAGTI